MTSTDAQALFDRAATRLRGVERGKMLSASGLRDPGAGKFFAFVPAVSSWSSSRQSA